MSHFSLLIYILRNCDANRNYQVLLIDFAIELVEKFPDLAKYDRHGRSSLKDLANKEFTSLEKSRLNFWEQLLYYCEINLFLIYLPKSCCLFPGKKGKELISPLPIQMFLSS